MPRAFGVKNTIILIFICAFIFPALSFSALVFAQESEFKEKCRSCHKEVLDKWDMSAIKHYPYREGKCESCHAAEHKKFTAEAGKPCLICHDLTSEKIKNSHFSVNLSDVDCVVPHQANDRIISAVAKKLKISKDKIFINIQKYGNMSAASIAVALYEAEKEKRIKKGSTVVLVTFGAGLVSAANVVKW